ncbi:class I SAM-dependent methyltransferase [Mesorhizobium sp. WSM4884]|uniref:class I SAM-dependent methyltransferase n=1 Tax=Mesorhizobium sp. WSM4884 TaxID=3038542 RepID=UPI002415B0DC|nr:class I SAM-dependent methyltransferase [Mesorhizobium sp. WSM4884]MDG4882689.1 class I SAM-dependent methyltransferase [Mesorhizobium sp. WSM4884]
MTRLENFISRMTAQRDILDHVCVEVAKMEGLVLELGLGNGRTFHHLRERLPGRRIVAFDREVGAHASSIPEAENLVLGEIRETARRFIGIDAALVHADIGTGYDDRDAVTATWLPDLIAGLLRVGGFAVSGTPLDHPQLQRLPAPTSEPAYRYFLCRRV